MFKCGNCGEEVTGSKMIGLALGTHLSASQKREVENLKSNAIDPHEVGSGFFSGLGVKCPKCGKSNWK